MSDTNASYADVIIVGGGIAGLLSAYCLLKKGVKVTLLEKGICFQEASWAGAGILSAMYPWRYPQEVNELIFQSQKMYPALCQQLNEESGIDPQFYRNGMLYPDLNQDQEGLDWIKKNDISCTFVPQERSGQYLSNHFQQAYLFENIANVRNPELGKALLEILRKSPNVSFYENNPVVKVEEAASGCTVETSQRKFLSDKVFLCAGPWLQELVSEPERQNLMPVRGDMLLYKTEPGFIPHMIMHDGRYIVPRQDGYVLVGSTQEYVGFDKSLSVENKASLEEFAVSIVPALKDQSVLKHWCGLRPGSKTGMPVLGRLSDRDKIYACGGLFRNGIAMAPACAERITQQILSD